MIVNEPMVSVLETSFMYTDTSKGEKVEAKTLVILPPTPRIDTLKLKQMIGRGTRSVALEAQKYNNAKSDDTPPENNDSSQPPLHILYRDGDEEKRAELLKKLEKEAELNESMLTMSDSINLTEFVSVFGSIMIPQNQCKVNGEEKLTKTMWADDIMPADKLRAALRYCCFFGITSSLTK